MSFNYTDEKAKYSGIEHRLCEQKLCHIMVKTKIYIRNQQ